MSETDINNHNGTITKREIKKEHAIRAWRETLGNVTKICQKVGINRKTFYDWLKDDEFLHAIKSQEDTLNDDIKDKLIEEALKGNLRAVIYYLEHKHPEFINREGSFSFSMNKPILGGISVQRERDEFGIGDKMEIEFVEDLPNEKKE